MANIRVYDLSKQLNVSNKEVIAAAKKIGIPVKSHASSISPEEAERIKSTLAAPAGDNGTLSEGESKEEERVRVFKTESGEEVIERRRGRSVIIRRRKKTAPPPEAAEVAPKPEEAPEERPEPAAETGAPVEEAVPPAPAEVPAPPAQPPTDEAPPAEAPAPAAGTAEAAPAAGEAPSEEVEGPAEEAAEGAVVEMPAAPQPPKPAKKVKKAKPKKEEIIDEETLEELRKAFKTKLPKRKREFLVGERRPSRGRLGTDGRRLQEVPPAGTAAAERAEQGAAARSRQVERAEKKPIKVGESITVGELAKRMSVKLADLIKRLMSLGVRATVNQSIDYDTAAIVAAEFGFETVPDFFEEKDLLEEEVDEALPLEPRSPVVTVMGHVDHGKTTLLDAIRKTRVAEGEAGGITQHIGAYTVDVDGRRIVFIDTPGHEAFTAMRARGAQVTDIVILVVAADDGVMPQTVEAVNHAKAAGVPIIVAINKIDKPEADKNKVLRELSEIGLVAEEWGGDVMTCDVSAKQGQGIRELLELVLLQADVLELKAAPQRRARGIVIESKLDRGRGAVASVIVQDGTLKVGDYVVAGLAYGRVRALVDDKGKRVKEAGPAQPVEIVGLSEVPRAGERFHVVKDEKTAKEIVQHRAAREREKMAARTARVSFDTLFEALKEGTVKELPLILKADTHGSLDALREAIEGIESEKCQVKVIHSGVGAVTETDVSLASASNAVVLGFNVRPEPKALSLAEQEGVSIELFDVIYNAIDRVKSAMVGLLEPIERENILGHAEVKATFHISKVGTIAGCMVIDGVIRRGARARVIRDGVTVYESTIASLKRFKEDVREVQAGYECGIRIENFNDVKVGDRIESFVVEEVQPEL